MTTATTRPPLSTNQESFIRRFRNRWNGLSRPQQWAGVIPIVVLIYFIPVINPPFLTTEPNTNFPIAMFHGATYALVAVGLNVVVGQAGLLDLGYIGFFAVGAYVAALFTSPESILWKVPYLGVLPIAMVDHDDGRACCSARRPCDCAVTTWPS